MKKSAKILSVLVGFGILTSFFSYERQSLKTKPHVYNKLECDSTEIEHRIASMDLILKNK